MKTTSNRGQRGSSFPSLNGGVTRRVLYVLVVAGLSSLSSLAAAQFLQARSTVPVITYQGSLTGLNAQSCPDGSYQLTVTLYGDAQGKEDIWTDTYTTEVKNGIFNIQLGSGKPLPEAKTLDRPLWLGVAVAGGTELRPLTKLGAVPFALNVADESVTVKKLSPEVIELLKTQDPQISNNNVYWSEAGNNSLPVGAYLGTSDASAVEMKVNANRVMKYTDCTTSTAHSNNILGGLGDFGGAGTGNSLGSGYGNVIAGGGWYDITNTVAHPNKIGSVALSHDCFIGSGEDNLLDAIGGVLTGGRQNTIVGSYSFIGGGRYNEVKSTTTGIVAELSSVTGGYQNIVRHQYSHIGGGSTNTVLGELASIVGGGSNTVGADAQYSAILGGEGNSVTGNHSSIIGGQSLSLSGNNSAGFFANTASTGVAVSAANTFYLGNVDLWLHSNDVFASAPRLWFYEPGGGNYSSFAAGFQNGDIRHTWPPNQGSTGKVLGISSQTGTGSSGDPYINTLAWFDPSANDWKITGNSGTTSVSDGGANFLGTTDNKAFEIRIGNQRGVKYIPAASSDDAPNIIAGYV